MFEFEYPYFFLLIFLPPVVYLAFGGSSSETDGMPTIYNPNIRWLTRAFGKKNEQGKLSVRFNVPLYIIWSLIVLALMHPQKIERISKTYSKGYDIMLAVDLSNSMRALDFADLSIGDMTNRLDVIKKIAGKFITDREGDRIGLILFGDSAYLQTPLTLDVASARTMLDLSEIGIAGDKTAIGDALALATKALIQRPEGSRIIILLTDGENTAGVIEPLEAARLAKSYGIKIYSIGVGKKGQVPYPDLNGTIASYRIEIDETTLRKVSEETGGAYFHAGDENTLREIYKKIDDLERTEAETSEYVIRSQLYRFPLALAMLGMLGLIISRYNWSKVF